ncbi:hypothetical protein B0H14DRAFT_3551061 [Mycena olivaceomarginata]|nr:hypothetical protein B0H14DRAFT_3551061 [Mycena olivaceomarginata]
MSIVLGPEIPNFKDAAYSYVSKNATQASFSFDNDFTVNKVNVKRIQDWRIMVIICTDKTEAPQACVCFGSEWIDLNINFTKEFCAEPDSKVLRLIHSSTGERPKELMNKSTSNSDVPIYVPRIEPLSCNATHIDFDGLPSGFRVDLVELKSVPDCRIVILRCTKEPHDYLFSVIRSDWLAAHIKNRNPGFQCKASENGLRLSLKSDISVVSMDPRSGENENLIFHRDVKVDIV